MVLLAFAWGRNSPCVAVVGWAHDGGAVYGTVPCHTPLPWPAVVVIVVAVAPLDVPGIADERAHEPEYHSSLFQALTYPILYLII